MITEERIERLERNNRRLLAGLVAVILLGIGVAAIPITRIPTGGMEFVAPGGHIFDVQTVDIAGSLYAVVTSGVGIGICPAR